VCVCVCLRLPDIVCVCACACLYVFVPDTQALHLHCSNPCSKWCTGHHFPHTCCIGDEGATEGCLRKASATPSPWLKAAPRGELAAPPPRKPPFPGLLPPKPPNTSRLLEKLAANGSDGGHLSVRVHISMGFLHQIRLFACTVWYAMAPFLVPFLLQHPKREPQAQGRQGQGTSHIKLVQPHLHQEGGLHYKMA